MCMNNSMCGCSSNNNVCENFGPFLAVDAACITPTTPVSTGSIIPFASGIVPVTLVTLASGAIDTVSTVGFGTAVTGVGLTGINIDLTAATSRVEAFTVPRDGTITSISATFVSTVVLSLGLGTATVRAQVYRAVAGSNVFSPTSAAVDLVPPLSAIAVGTIASGNANVSVPVATGDRLLMVFSLTTTGLTVGTTLTGNASAGINIV